MSDEEFEELVADALDEIPERFLERLHNVVFLIEEEPSAQQVRDAGNPDLLGLYEGLARTDSDGSYAEPNRIFIFRGPTLRMCETADEVAEEVIITVFHEVAHHFGIDEDELWELGWS